MNVAVLNLRTIIKYLALVLVLIVCISSARIFYNEKKIESIEIEDKITYINSTKYIEEALPDILGKRVIKIANNKQNKIINILSKELPMTKAIIEEDIPHEEEDKEEIITENTEDIELAKTDVQTQEIKEHNIQAKYTTQIGNIKIKNETDKEIPQDLLSLDTLPKNNKDIIIFHTHTCESYTATPEFNYEMTGTYRTTDLNYSVARVGDELNTHLLKYGFNVYHDKTYHDYPAYTGSYGRSLETVKNILENKMKSDIIIDLHRDAIGSDSNYAPSVKIGEETAAQLMLVIGTDGGGLEHAEWIKNLGFAVHLQEKANELYPNLFRPIILRNSRYNQHLGQGAIIVEVGATGNTMEQCLVSMKYLAKIISEVEQNRTLITFILFKTLKSVYLFDKRKFCKNFLWNVYLSNRKVELWYYISIENNLLFSIIFSLLLDKNYGIIDFRNNSIIFVTVLEICHIMY